MKPLVEIIEAFHTLKDCCAECDMDCKGCLFLDEEESCIFGTIAPWEWKLPKGNEDADIPGEGWETDV